MPFIVILIYARVMSAFRLIPIFGDILEKSNVVVQGDVPKIAGEGVFQRLVRRYKAATLNTFDAYGSHEFQHHKSDFEILRLAIQLQPDSKKIQNIDDYFSRPQKIGCALRVFK